MIKLVTHEQCNECPLFEAKCQHVKDCNVEGCVVHYISCIHHPVCAAMENRVQEELKKRKKEN